VTLDLAELMQRATDEIPVDTARLVNGGLARGAALTRRRHRRTVVGTGVAMTLATLVGWGFLPSADEVVEETPSTRNLAAGPAAATEFSIPTAKDLTRRLEELLPGTAHHVKTPKLPYSLDLFLELERPGSAPGSVQVSLGLGEPIPEAERQERVEPCLSMQGLTTPRDGADCVLVDDGWVELWLDDVPPGDDSGLGDNVMMAQAVYSGYDGRVVMVTAWNTPSTEKDAAFGTPPVVSTDQLLDIVQDPRWFDAT
jgi:hypothetical protein